VTDSSKYYLLLSNLQKDHSLVDEFPGFDRASHDSVSIALADKECPVDEGL
jgi:hypothetical protein